MPTAAVVAVAVATAAGLVVVLMLVTAYPPPPFPTHTRVHTNKRCHACVPQSYRPPKTAKAKAHAKLNDWCVRGGAGGGGGRVRSGYYLSTALALP